MKHKTISRRVFIETIAQYGKRSWPFMHNLQLRGVAKRVRAI